GPNAQITFIHTADWVLGLYGYDDLAVDAVATNDWADHPAGVALALNLESVEAVDAAATELNALGVKILKGPEKAFWGGYNFYFADPDGHRWEVAFNPYASFDESGSLTEI
ncbi:MAG: VOC family protein, partial [Acidimicrobiales bacterium]